MSDWPAVYQTRLLAWLCLEPQCGRYFPYMKAEYFETLFLQTMAPLIKEHWEKYRQRPTVTVLRTEYHKLPAIFQAEEKQQFEQLFALVEAGTFPELAYVKETFTAFVRNRELLAILASDESQQLINKGDWSQFLHEVRKAQPAITDVEADLDVFDLEILAPLYQANAMKVGLRLVDHHIGGLFRKELLLFQGDKKAGKSTIKIYCGGQLLRQGLTVLHCTLEMNKARTMHRYFTTLADPKDDIRYGEFLALDRRPEHVIRYLARLKERYYGKLILVDLPANTATLEDVERLIEEHRPDAFIVDYLMLMRPPARYNEKRHELTEIATGLHEFTKRYNIGGISSTQTNRGAANKRVVEGTDTAEDYGLNRVPDNVVGIGGTREDRKRKQRVLTLSDARNVESGLSERYNMVFDHMRLDFVQPEVQAGLIEDY